MAQAAFVLIVAQFTQSPVLSFDYRLHAHRFAILITAQILAQSYHQSTCSGVMPQRKSTSTNPTWISQRRNGFEVIRVVIDCCHQNIENPNKVYES